MDRMTTLSICRPNSGGRVMSAHVVFRSALVLRHFDWAVGSEQPGGQATIDFDDMADNTIENLSASKPTKSAHGFEYLVRLIVVTKEEFASKATV